MTTFIEPMLAHPMTADFSPAESGWVAEEKYDGHRLCVVVNGKSVKAWSRNAIARALPPHLVEALGALPDGTFDGELIALGKQKSYGVTELTNADKLCFVVFDILEVMGRNTMSHSYGDRRLLLEETFRTMRHNDSLLLSWMTPVRKMADVHRLAQEVWARGGEGLIVKRLEDTYTPSKRSRGWLKVKQCGHATLKIIGYVPGKLGPYATVLLEDKDGNTTKVKTLNDKERAALAKNPVLFIGEQLCIEFQERTPDGSYRHPRWDHWASQSGFDNGGE